MKLYYESMSKLNFMFAKWAKEEEQRICAEVESGELTLTTVPKSLPSNYGPDVMLYVQKAEEIKKKYQPATGDVLTFGSGDFGQLGHPYIEDADNDAMTPRCIMSIRNTKVTSVSCGGLHSLCVNEGGEVLSWGSNDEGSLGIVEVVTGHIPLAVKGFIPSQYEVARGLEAVNTWRNVRGNDLSNPKTPLDSKYEEKLVSVAAGDCHSLCLSITGRAYFFGAYKDKDGKSWRDIPPEDDPRVFKKKAVEIDPEFLDDDKDKKDGTSKPVEEEPPQEEKADVPPVGCQLWPSHVWQIDGEVLDIDCGGSFNAAIVERKDEKTSQYNKICVTWGMGECGELARPIETPVKDLYHKPVPGEPSLAAYAIDAIQNDYLAPKPVVWVDSMDKRRVEAISCGGFHLLVISRNLVDGSCSVHSSGLNNYGQLGLGDEHYDSVKDKNPDKNKLTEIKAFRGKSITQVAGGLHHSLAVESNGNLYAFGRGDYGQLGNTESQPKAGHLENKPVPVHLVEGEPNPSISQISAGSNQNFVLTSGGDVYSWGYGDTGCLGHGIVEDEHGRSLQVSDEFRPRKLDVLKRINAGRKKKGRTPMTTNVHHVASGGQHSAIVCSLLE